VWSKYAIPSGPIASDHAETLQVHLQAHVLAQGARVAMVPYLYSIDQLPRHFSELRRLAAKLAEAALANEKPRLELTRLPETAHLLADTRFIIACAAVPKGQALFRWQEDASGHAGRAGSLEQWIAQARPTISKLLPGCVFESLLPDAYYVNCRESDRRVRPFGIRAAVAFLENALKMKAAEIKAVGRRLRRGADRRIPRGFLRKRRDRDRARRRVAALRPRGRERAPGTGRRCGRAAHRVRHRRR
jgi:hypothetical protein